MKNCKQPNPKCATVCGVDVVVLPVPMGTSDEGQPYAPKTCDYKNTFVKYLADGRTYFYDKNGAYILVNNPSNITVDDRLDPESQNPVQNRVITDVIRQLEASLLDETEARTEKDADLQTQIDAITSASDVVDVVGTYEELEDYDTSGLTDNDIVKVLEDETHDGETTYYRWDAENQTWNYVGAMGPYYTKSETDSLLADQKAELEGEITDLDTTLTAAIEAEESARTTADGLLQVAIDNEVAARSEADSTLTTNLAAETTAREAADTALNTAITDESTTRATADTTLSDRITAEVTARENGDSLLRTDLNSEITNRTNADTTLETAITNEATTRASETGALRSDLTAETTARSTADSTLQDNIDAEATARANADTALAGDISDEATARTNADTTLQNNITAEATARANADTTLQGNIDAEATARGNADTALGNRITTLESDVNRSVMNDLVMETGANSVTFVEKKINLSTGTTSEERDVIPSASSSVAGTITAADYTSIQNSQERLDALENGSVAIDNLPASPTQQELTDAWLLATDRQTLINRASIYDIDNTKVWTYYSNIAEWEMITAGTISVNPFSNSAAGIILGSSLDGNVSANVDGTGSVAGWTALTNTVAGKQNTIDSSHPLSADLVDDANTTHKFTTAADITKLSGIAAGAEVNVQSDWNVTDNTSDAFIKNKPSLATVATTGDYDDLTNKPTLATVATSGSYNDLTNKPTIPTVNNATLTIQKNGTSVGTFTANSSTNATANITVPTKTSDLTNDSSFATTGEVTSAVDGLAATLATVATTGSYNDLANKPTIPTVNNATLTIQKNGTTVNTFTANASSNVTANITVPTKTSDLTNDSGFITDRFYRSLVPFGTAIAANKDLNTKEFLVVGKYYCSTNATVATLSNCPTNNAFMMEVFSPLNTTVDNEDTAPWVYRYRLLTEFNGRMWVQQANSGATAGTFTYGAWRKFTWDSDLPTVNNGTLTIQKNGTNVQTFTANQSSNATANITVPTKTSDITNDSGFLTNTDLSDVAFVLGDATTDTGAAIGTSNIVNGAVTAEKIANGAVDNIIMTTNDPGEGVALNQNEYIAVYENTNQTGWVDSADITNGAVTTAKLADTSVTTAKITNNAVTASKIDFTTFEHTRDEQQIGVWYDGKPICRKILTGTTPNAASTHINHGITNFYAILEMHGYVMSGSNGSQPLPRTLTDTQGSYGICFGDFTSTSFLMQVGSNSDIRNKPYEIELVYLKSS